MFNQKVLITGINGFVGRNLEPYLTNDFDVGSIARNNCNLGLTYRKFFGEPTVYNILIHLAGKAHDLKNTVNDKEYYEVNFELTKQLYDQFLASQASTFIYISSVKAVADTVTTILTEADVPNPATVYGKSKLMAENYILEHLPVNKRVYILRPCMIHGPNNKGNLNLLFNLVSKGFPWPLGAFRNQRSFLSIENLCFVIKELLSNNHILSGIYNIADDQTISTNALVDLIRKSQNKTARIFSIPKVFITAVAKIGDIFRLPLNSERLQKLTESYVVSNKKIVSAIGKPLPVSSQDGLVRTLGSFVEPSLDRQ